MSFVVGGEGKTEVDYLSWDVSLAFQNMNF